MKAFLEYLHEVFKGTFLDPEYVIFVAVFAFFIWWIFDKK